METPQLGSLIFEQKINDSKEDSKEDAVSFDGLQKDQNLPIILEQNSIEIL